jgi:ABC-2 type transport system permease protein
VALLVAITLFGLNIPMDRWLPLLGIGFAVALAAAGLGLGLGAWLRDYRTLQPLLYVTAAGSFFAAGGYGSVATLPPAVRAFDMFWPPAYVFETMQAVMHMAVLPDLSGVLIALPVAADLGIAFGAWMMRHAM